MYQLAAGAESEMGVRHATGQTLYKSVKYSGGTARYSVLMTGLWHGLVILYYSSLLLANISPNSSPSRYSQTQECLCQN